MTSLESGRPSLLVKWMQDGVFKCLYCGSARLDLSADEVSCGACDATWPVRNQVPDFFNRYTATGGDGSEVPPGSEIEEDLVGTLVRSLDLGEGAAVRSRVREIIQRSQVLSCENQALSAEIRDLIDRFAPAPIAAPLPSPQPQSNRDACIGLSGTILVNTIRQEHLFAPTCVFRTWVCFRGRRAPKCPERCRRGGNGVEIHRSLLGSSLFPWTLRQGAASPFPCG